MIDPDREAHLRRAIEDLYFGYRAFTALPDRILAERGLGRAHHRILYFVCRDPGILIGDLLSVLNITKQAAHRPIRELQAQSLVKAVSADEDRRARRLFPTPQGTGLEAKLSQAQMSILNAAFQDQGETAERHWHQIMARLRSAAAI